jgi:cysteine synthase
MLRYWGCELTLTSSDDPDSSIWAAKEQAERETEGIFYINQNENPDNVLAHQEGTGREIVTDLGGDVDVVVAGFGTGGTLMGLSEAFRDAGLGARIVSAEPTVSKSAIEGIKQSGEGYMPTIYDSGCVNEIIRVEDHDAIATARLLSEQEGIFAGTSSGATVWAAMQIARKMERGNIVAIIADSAQRYFSTPLFDQARGEDAHT